MHSRDEKGFSGIDSHLRGDRDKSTSSVISLNLNIGKKDFPALLCSHQPAPRDLKKMVSHSLFFETVIFGNN
jgi:hypothetical protein